MIKIADFNLAKHNIFLKETGPVEISSAWAGHIPFAYFITSLLRPALIVELGVYSGGSYHAFCHAVQQLGLHTKCYGVDTWQGDQHTGSYEEEIYERVSRYQQAHFSSFSNLLKKTFDEALQDFADGSIDLLHIDGCHTYEAVKHDFTAWLPKMKKDGVIMLHDISERSGDFGVWRLWEELKENYSTIEMSHSHGLGLVFLGFKNPEVEAFVRSFEQDDFTKPLFEKLGGTVKKNEELKLQNNHLDQSLSKYCLELDHKNRELEQKEEEISARAIELEEKQQELLALDREIEEKNRLISEVINSTSWKLTAPLRAAGTISRRLAGHLTRFRQAKPVQTSSGSSVPAKDKPDDFNSLVENYFQNRHGLEIGGPSSIFEAKGFLPLYDQVKVLDGINYASKTVWTGEIDVENGFIVEGCRAGEQYISDAVDLSAIKDRQYDFIISSNVIEHIANPLRAVEEWLSVLKPGGALLIVAPRKESNFDHRRDIVKFSHLLEDYHNKTGEDDLTHLDEIMKLHDLDQDKPAGSREQFYERSLNNYENRCLHQHVYDMNVLEEIYNYFNLTAIYRISYEYGYVLVGRKESLIRTIFSKVYKALSKVLGRS